jgi:hypothetical protein
MRYTDYIKRNDIEFCDQGDGIVEYAMENCSRWGVIPPTQEMAASLKDLRTKVEKCRQQDHSPIDTLAKNNARKAAEKDVRNYVQGFIAHNINVTDEDRRLMDLPIYDKKPTPVGNPVGLVTANFRSPNRGALEMLIEHVEGSPFDRKANYGYKIQHAVIPYGAPVPESVNELPESRFTRRKREMFIFDKLDSGKTACFCLRYENSKGKAGQWGPIVSAVIP